MILSEKESILVSNYFFGNDENLSPNVAPHKQSFDRQTDKCENRWTDWLPLGSITVL